MAIRDYRIGIFAFEFAGAGAMFTIYKPLNEAPFLNNQTALRGLAQKSITAYGAGVLRSKLRLGSQAAVR